MAQSNLELMISGRLVGGHPMVQQPQTDDKTGLPRLNKAGVQTVSTYIGVAIPKTQQDWKLEPWGQQLAARGAQDWPNGEHGAPTFAWKIVDGDCVIPNKKGNKPSDREGYPGHWVLNCSTQFSVRCHHTNKYEPHEAIQTAGEIKAGDYCRVLLTVKGNGPSESPGMYLNPTLFELSRAGVEIVLSTGPSAADVFGGSAMTLPANAQLDTAIQSTVAVTTTIPATTPPPPPADDLIPPPPPVAEDSYEYGGVTKTKSAWLATPGYLEAHLASMNKV